MVFSIFFNLVVILFLGNGLSFDVICFIGVFYVEVILLKGLLLKIQYGVDYVCIEEQCFWFLLYGDGVNSKGLVNVYNIKNNRWIWINMVIYNFFLGQNNFNLLVGMEVFERNNFCWIVQCKDLQDDKFVVF